MGEERGPATCEPLPLEEPWVRTDSLKCRGMELDLLAHRVEQEGGLELLGYLSHGVETGEDQSRPLETWRTAQGEWFCVYMPRKQIKSMAARRHWNLSSQ